MRSLCLPDNRCDFLSGRGGGDPYTTGKEQTRDGRFSFQGQTKKSQPYLFFKWRMILFLKVSKLSWNIGFNLPLGVIKVSSHSQGSVSKIYIYQLSKELKVFGFIPKVLIIPRNVLIVRNGNLEFGCPFLLADG